MPNATKSEENGWSATARRRRAGRNDGVLGFRADVADDSNARQQQHRAARRSARLREGETGLAQLAIEKGGLVLQLRGAAAIDMTQFVQHCALLGNDQQYCKRKNDAYPTHVCQWVLAQIRPRLP